ncbi:MAG: glycosyltransferase family 2 protein [Bdellovibrionales bacterium]|nr:glycosyltransferase family 2 protein [Bdellovibrionales bacterium]
MPSSPKMNNINYLSVIIPVLNEEENIDILISRLSRVLGQREICDRYEIIFVDDGSTDSTRGRVIEACERNDNIKAIFFRRNFGKSAALMAGFKEACGEVILTMDGDLQDEPTEIHKLVNKLNEGYDLVSGWKRTRNDSLEKVVASRIFNWIISRVLRLKLHDFNSGFKIYKSWTVKDIRLSGNLYRFLPVFVERQGGRVAEVPVTHNKRIHGISKYGLKRYLHGLFDLLTMIFLSSFLFRPMYFFGLAGLPLMGLGISGGFYLLVKHLFWLVTGDISYQLNSRPLLIIALGITGLGLSIFLFGLLAELILHVSSATTTPFFYSIEKTISKRQGSERG